MEDGELGALDVDLVGTESGAIVVAAALLVAVEAEVQVHCVFGVGEHSRLVETIELLFCRLLVFGLLFDAAGDWCGRPSLGRAFDNTS